MLKIIAAVLLILSSVPAKAQLYAAKSHSVAMGHHHLNVEDVEENLAFFTALGGEKIDFAHYQIVRFPNVLVFLRAGKPTAESSGSVVHHFGLHVKDLSSVLARLRAANMSIVSKEFIGDKLEVDDQGIAYNPAMDARLAFARAPNGTWIELYEKKDLNRPVENHHIHFYEPEFEAMKTWYVTMLGAKPGQRGGMEAADLGGVNLTFSPEEKQAPTKGRALDHIGFEVDNLEEFCRELKSKGVKFDRPYEELPELGVAIAFFTDPWGTNVELTEGLDRL